MKAFGVICALAAVSHAAAAQSDWHVIDVDQKTGATVAIDTARIAFESADVVQFWLRYGNMKDSGAVVIKIGAQCSTYRFWFDRLIAIREDGTVKSDTTINSKGYIREPRPGDPMEKPIKAACNWRRTASPQ